MSDDLKAFIADKFEEQGQEIGRLEEAVDGLRRDINCCQQEMRPKVEELEKAKDNIETTVRNVKWVILAILGTGGIGGILKELWVRLR